MHSIATAEIKSVYKLSPTLKIALDRLGLRTFEDILRFQPIRYASYDENQHIANLEAGVAATIYGTIQNVKVRKSWNNKIPMTEGYISDGISKIKLFWFNQPYIGKMYPEDTLVCIKGTPQEKNGALYFSNPIVEKVSSMPEYTDGLFANSDLSGQLTPIYRETKGVSSRIIHEIVKRIILTPIFENIEDPIPEYIREAIHIPKLRDAMLHLHIPTDEKMTLSARKRFLFEEMFYVQLKISSERAASAASPAYKIKIDDINNFFEMHGYTPTSAQVNSTNLILKDLQKGIPMQRLLEGDVGSGKTLVAAAASYATILCKRDEKKLGTPLQVAYLAPTEVLAYQQFESFIKFLAHTGIEIGYLSGTKALKYPSKLSDQPTKVSRAQLLKWVSEGKISLLVGTHAITKKSVDFKDLALIIIDEQHRFGVNARKSLAHKRGDKRPEIPHLLSMTATPIPRTLALALFGDLDLTVIDEMPVGRKPIQTILSTNKNRDDVYDHIKQEIKNGRQAYVICTRISEDEDDKSNKKSVESEIKNLKKIFTAVNIGAMHSKLKTDDKEKVIEDFKNKKIDILVSTSVVEVGVNIPNASIMIIEDADKFGLSQLHQLRGRIGRSNHQSYCYIFTNSEGEKTVERLKNFSKTNSGFELAEIDMAERGPGSLISSKQSGMSDLAMEALKNLKLVETAKTYAREIIDNDPSLENFSELKTKLSKLDDLHLE
jgi:ATP-dependent DNA helicase RecG